MILATETDKAYIAGIVDGEGSMGITERGRPPTRCQTPSFVCWMSVSMTDKEAVDFISSRYKGNYHMFSRLGKRDYYRFMASCASEVETILADIQPYIKVKSLQVSAMLDYLKLPRFKGGYGKEVPYDIIEKRRFYVAEIKSLNQRRLIL